MSPDSRLALRFATIPTALLAAIGILGVGADFIAVKRAGFGRMWAEEQLPRTAIWWCGALVITWLALAVACWVLSYAQHLRGPARSITSGAVGALVPVVVLVATVSWVSCSYSIVHTGEWLGCLLPARSLILGAFLASVVAPGVFLYRLRRQSASA